MRIGIDGRLQTHIRTGPSSMGTVRVRGGARIRTSSMGRIGASASAMSPELRGLTWHKAGSAVSGTLMHKAPFVSMM